MGTSTKATLREAVQSIDQTALATAREQAVAERAEILQRFPLEEWPDLPLNRYALGTEESGNSFCWWLEFGSPKLGSMKGGNARKMLIYRQSDDGEWYYPNRYSSVEEAWLDIRAGFVDAFRYADEGRWDLIDSVGALRGGRAIRTKALHIYFPEEVFPIYSYDHIVRFLNELDAYDPQFADLDVVSLNRALLTAIRSIPELTSLELIEIMHLFYQWEKTRTSEDESGNEHYIPVQPFSKESYVKAFKKIDPKMSEGQRKMLLAQYSAPGRTMSSAQMAEIVGYKSYGGANLQYGNLGSMVAEALDEQLPENEDLAASYVLSAGVGRVAKKTFRWVMHNEVASALEELGWVGGDVTPGFYRSGAALMIDEQVLSQAVEVTIRPHLINNGGLYDVNIEGYQHQKIIAQVQPFLTPDSLTANPDESLITALKAKENLLSQYEYMKSMAFIADSDPDAIGHNVQNLLYGEAHLEDRIRVFLDWSKPYEGEDGKERALNATVASYLLAISQPDKYAFCKPSVYSAAVKALCGDSMIVKDPVHRVVHCTEFYRETLHLFKEVYELPFSDLMHVHIAFFVMQSDKTGYPTWDDLTEDRPSESVETLSPPPYTVDDAIQDLFVNRETFEHWLKVLTAKKNVILQGPPGVGKTFVAKRLAYALMGERDDDRLEMVQFHQAYTYEDFIQGFRPSDDGNFRLKDGTFYLFCKRALLDPNRDYVFIIDEINRGNLSKILGELMMLIEADKRGPQWSMPLTYTQDSKDRSESSGKFHVPENVHLIGMMNTADRSLAMVDYALRRRFAFITLTPQFQSPSYSDFLKKRGASDALVHRIIKKMKELNETIQNDATNLGEGFCIGHSYFCPANGLTVDADWYDYVIDLEIAPLIREYWFDKPKKADELISSLKSD